MYSFAQRCDTKVIDEPFYAYYLSKSAVRHPGQEEILSSMSTDPNEIMDSISNLSESFENVFIKNMAHHLIELDLSFLKKYKNVFLIRDPKELIHSFSKVIKSPQMSDIGCELQYSQYQFLKEEQDCPVIDSNNILKNPESSLKKLLSKIGMDWDAKMLKWEPGSLPEDGCWAKYWYSSVHHSNGFKPYLKKEVKLDSHNFNLYTQALSYFTALKKNEII